LNIGEEPDLIIAEYLFIFAPLKYMAEEVSLQLFVGLNTGVRFSIEVELLWR
jgi:hypothetical protein